MMNTDSNGAVHLPPKSPTQTNVTVMTDTGPNPQSLEIRLNIGYFKTAPGIVKILQLVSQDGFIQNFKSRWRLKL